MAKRSVMFPTMLRKNADMIFFFMLQFYVQVFIGIFPRSYGIVSNSELPVFNIRMLLSFIGEKSTGNFIVYLKEVLP
jgi:hypothetical protein